MRTANTFCKLSAPLGLALIVVLCGRALGEPPPDLPGQEISGQYMETIIPKDSLAANPPDNLPESSNWFDRAQRTWDAPFLSQQIAEDNINIPIGKGAIFIPRMSSDVSLEPDVDILDSNGRVVYADKVGRKICLEEGTYYVMLGSGSRRQLMARQIRVVESKINPLIPDWTCLAIDVVDQNSLPIRGQYEITRMDEFDPYGRGYGRDPNLGEELKTWVLKPGIYKIFSVGQGYNTLTNFITVRLMPGEMTHVLLVQNSSDFKIISGGTADVKLARALTSRFKYGLDIGGSMLFSSDNNYVDNVANKTTIALLANTRLQYKTGAHETNLSLRLDEGLNFIDFKIAHLNNDLDEFRLTTLYIWRLITWFGPYGRFEVLTTVFPQYQYFDDTHNQRHYFFMLRQDSTLSSIDSTNSATRLKPSFSPINLQAGLGGNLDVVNTRYVEAKFRTGLGFTRETNWQMATITDTAAIQPKPLPPAVGTILATNASYAVIRPLRDTSIYSYGPEAAVTVLARIGRWAMIETKFNVLTPLERIRQPDYDWTSTISWRIIAPVTLDYQYTYAYHPSQVLENLRRQSLHRVLLRFSYTSR